MIAIVTETLSCLNEADVAAYGVSLAPLECMAGTTRFSDRILSTAEVLPDGEAYSIPPSEEAYHDCFAARLSTHDCVLCITASRKFSDSYINASRAAASFGGRVVVIDSASVAGGLFLLVVRARALAAGGYPMSRIKAELESYKHTLRVAFTADSATALQNARKLSYKLPSIASDTAGTPVFHIKRGGIGVVNFAEGTEAVMDGLLAVLESDGTRRAPSRIMVHYADRTPAVEYLLGRIESLYPSASVYERPITLSLQVNLGKDIVGVIGD